jgi:twinkle protein
MLTSKSPLDFLDSIDRLYERGLGKGASTGWPTVDEHFTVELGQWTVITGVPGHGKSEWTDALMINLSRQGWQFVMFSPENQPHQLHVAKMLEKWLEKPFGVGPSERMRQDEYREACIDLANRVAFLTVDAEFAASPSVLAVIEAVAKQVQFWRDGGSGRKVAVVIDPWNEMDHARPSNQTETEYISQTLSMVRQFARDWNLHIFLVAHPTKISKDKDGKYPICRLWDISGSAHWNNKADNGITIHRDVSMPGSPIQVHILKIRFKHIGKPGMVNLDYNRVTGVYRDPAGTTIRPSKKLLAAGDDTCPI